MIVLFCFIPCMLIWYILFGFALLRFLNLFFIRLTLYLPGNYILCCTLKRPDIHSVITTHAINLWKRSAGYLEQQVRVWAQLWHWPREHNTLSTHFCCPYTAHIQACLPSCTHAYEHLLCLLSWTSIYYHYKPTWKSIHFLHVCMYMYLSIFITLVHLLHTSYIKSLWPANPKLRTGFRPISVKGGSL